MHACDRCGSNNADTRRYCWSCGRRIGAAAVPGQCPRCGFSTATADHWCGGCGLALARDAAEWRQLTVMFCDLAGSTAMSVVLDPEALREVNRRYQETVTAEIERFGGYVARYMGDGVLAYFGWPRAHEDDPQRAVRAGLAAIEAMQAVDSDVHARLGVHTRIRIGIATGRVVVGDLVGSGAAQEAAVVGETPNLAARLQGEAGEDEVVVSDETRRRVAGDFRLRSLGARPLKGLRGPVEVFAVEGLARRTRPLSGSIVGRSEELAWLEHQWAHLEAGPRLVLVSGEAGIGKSRLLEAFVADRPHRALHASPFQAATALHPLLGEEWDTERTHALLRWARGEIRIEGEEPERIADRLADALIDEVLELARTPFVLFVEDAHWLDPTTLDWIGRLCARTSQAPLLLLVSFRPHFEPPWKGHRLDLQGVTAAEVRSLIDEVAGAPLPAAVVEHILARTDGIPLFVEELTRALLESGQLDRTDAGWTLRGGLDELAVPGTLQDSMMARLDQLGFAKELAQVGAVIGRWFPRDLAASLCSLDGVELDRAWERLVDSRLAVPEGDGLLFRHAMVQDTAYDSLLRTRRRALHGRVAELLGERRNVTPERLAQHLSAAGHARPAIERWREAAALAANRFANREAVDHLSHALRAAHDLSDDELEFELRLALAARARVLEDFDLLHCHLDRAQALAEQRTEDRWLAEIHHTRGNARFHQGDPEGCFAEHALAREYAERAGDPALIARALSGAGDAAYMDGRFVTGERHFVEAVAISEREGLPDRAVNLAMAGWCRSFLDDAEGARDALGRAMSLARELDLPRPEMISCGGLAWCENVFGTPERGIAYGERALELGRSFGSASFESMACWYLADSYLVLEDPDTARPWVELGLRICRERGGNHFAGGALLGAQAELVDTDAELERVLETGERLVSQRMLWSAGFWFHRGALRACLTHGHADRAEAQKAALRALIGPEPVPLIERILAACPALP